MPLQILLPMVVAGIAGIALLTHLLGLSRARILSNAEIARAAWDREFPDDPAVFAAVSSGGRAALIESSGGTGIVWVMGADTVARSLAGAAVVVAEDGLTIRFPDFAAPHVHVQLDESCDAEAWSALLAKGPEANPA